MMEKMEKSSSSSNVPISKPWQSYHTVYTNAKAGMDGVDKEKVQRIVYEMSKGSKYFENEERKEALMRQKTENMRERCGKLSTADISHYQKCLCNVQVAERRMTELEAKRDLSRIWLHVDMDAFYAAVETLSNPSLKGKPMAVGSLSMLSTANYEARRYGVRAAMPGFIARKLCPELVFVPVDFEKYTYYSTLTRKDEAYLDITEVCRDRDLRSDDVAEEIRRSVFEETGLTCSAGVAPNRLLAKVCSDINKPNGQFILPSDRMAVMTFISSLPIRKVSLLRDCSLFFVLDLEGYKGPFKYPIGGIGKVTEQILRNAFEIDTCKDLLEKGSFLCALFSPSSADFFLSVGLGLGSTDAPQARLRKSMSNERTFSATQDEDFLYQKLAELAETLSTDLQKEGLYGRTLTLKLKTACFEVRSRAVTLSKCICSSEDILLHAKKLLKAELPASLRLIGLRVSQFSEDKSGPSDPRQKSITNFVIVGDASGNNIHDSDSMKLKPKDDRFSHEIGDDIAACDPSSGYVHEDVSSSDQYADFCYSSCSIDKNATDMERNSVLLDSNQAEEIAGFVEQRSEPRQPFSQPLMETEHCLSSISPDEVTGCPSDDDAAPSSSQQDQFQWVDGYKCSICGIEMPLEFVHERQEHFDFHLAERLQEECSGSSSMNHCSKQRKIQKDQIVHSRKKRRNLVPEKGKYLHIDQFFTKKNQNA
ncbi:DNA polymerase kappa isoform X3 [Beta vulgaris subsp. vulgaris]|uniref:DNA polymerase kappa isoform X3 n=1 Tax=Beta vulgaris subsp. vulgaris TaxID=3555 RepID=UPI0020368A54|nr:DNA polymerase kappa isoform X3 [Beta vulgaris subsp. vulgaris]